MTLYHRINQPEKFRKHLLLASKEVVLMQKKQHPLIEIKEQKLQAIKRMEDNMKLMGEHGLELEKLLTNNELKKKLDKQAPPSFNQIVPGSAQKNVVQEKKQFTVNELDRLDYTLKKIEDKISKFKL